MNQDTSKTVNKIWQLVKTLIEVIIAALAGAATATTANACGLLALLQ